MKDEERDIERLVPSLDLCRQIPEGKFANSALIWMDDGSDWWVNVRDYDPSYDEAFPAPTLAEIMDELPRTVEYRWYEDGFYPSHPKFYAGDFADKNAAAAALKLWLALRERGLK